MKFYRGRSLRGKVFRVILVGVVLPLVLVGLWLTELGTRSEAGLIRNGSIAILIVAAGSLIVSTVLTRHITRAMEQLALATQAVAGGDLDRRVPEHGEDEVGQVGRAFNAMTESLRATLRKLSQREALVAVGEFAASLAHEVRNPLTSIRMDLQSVEEQLPGESSLRVQLGRALREVQRLDQTVSGALRIARSGAIKAELVDARVPLKRAVEMATPAFDQVQASLNVIGSETSSILIRGDESALEQVFLNVLLNAAQAITPGGHARATIGTAGESLLIDIEDDGPGIPPERMLKIFEPFYSTKADGTGLGLPVARQIVHAHGGTISVEGRALGGTVVRLSFPITRENGQPDVIRFFRW